MLSGSAKFGLGQRKGNKKPAPLIRLTKKGGKGGKGVTEVLIPGSVWTAACCGWSEGPFYWKRRKTESVAALINNDPGVDPFARQMNLPQLEKLLTDVPMDPVDLFPGNPQCRTNSLTL